jgi:hypothetical protein
MFNKETQMEHENQFCTDKQEEISIEHGTDKLKISTNDEEIWCCQAKGCKCASYQKHR